MISRIYSTLVAVADQDKALDFYVNTLGWNKVMDNQMGPDMRYVTVAPPGAETQLVLGHVSWFGDGPAPAKAGISLVSPDIEATYAALKGRGVEFKQPLEDMPWGAKATWFYDIDGNEFLLSGEQG